MGANFLLEFSTLVDWSHVNDVKFIPGSALNQTFDSLLISIRNFNLIVLVNWTAELNDIMQGSRYGNLNNVYWYFGNNGTFTTLAQQHNPSLLPNGDIVIADSNNNRVIEINRTTKQIVWSLSQAGGINFDWPRDIIYNQANDTFIITDSLNNRIVEVNRNGTILWQWTANLDVPYSAEYMPNGDILISGCGNGVIMEVNRTASNPGSIVWSYNLTPTSNSTTQENQNTSDNNNGNVIEKPDLMNSLWLFNWSVIFALASLGLGFKIYRSYQLLHMRKIKSVNEVAENPKTHKLSRWFMQVIVLSILFTVSLYMIISMQPMPSVNH